MAVVLNQPNPYKVMIQSLWTQIARDTIELWCDKLQIMRPDVSLYIVLRV